MTLTGNMTGPMRGSPVLTGEDAERFFAQLKERSISPEARKMAATIVVTKKQEAQKKGAQTSK